jgi:hypothetical protein
MGRHILMNKMFEGETRAHSTAPKEHHRCTKEDKWAHQRHRLKLLPVRDIISLNLTSHLIFYSNIHSKWLSLSPPTNRLVWSPNSVHSILPRRRLPPSSLPLCRTLRFYRLRSHHPYYYGLHDRAPIRSDSGVCLLSPRLRSV